MAILARVAVFLALAITPLTNQHGLPVSPLDMQEDTDMHFFLLSAERYFGEDRPAILEVFKRYYQGADVSAEDDLPGSILSGRQQYYLAPPFFPTLLHIFDYGPGNTLPLALLFLLVSCLLVAAWLAWLRLHGVGLRWLLLFALIPNPIWFTLNISSDLIFATFFAGFFLSYFSPRASTPGARLVWLGCMLGMLLTRPNGLALVLFVAIDQAFLRRPGLSRRTLILIAVPAAIFAAIASYLLIPHFAVFLKDGGNIGYFGTSQRVYLAGIFDALPGAIDHIVSWIALIGAKFLYFAGLRPSYGDLPLPLLLLRSLPGLILLPGLVYALVRGSGRLRLLLIVMVVPVLMGASQDRYNLPIQPVLLLAGAIFLGQLYASITRTKPSNATSGRGLPFR